MTHPIHMNRLALFSAEASLQIGTGHVMRCLVLAEALENAGWECCFISSQTSYDLVKRAEKFKRLNPKEIWQNPLKADLLVVDNYSRNSTYESHFKKHVKTILVIDDLADRKHECDILLDQNLGSKATDYRDLVNADCEILTGTEFCLLRPEFAAARPAALQKRSQTKKIGKILVNFGGSDINNHSLKALEMLEKSSFQGDVGVVLGFNAIHFDKIQNFAVTSKNQITIHKQADMAQLIFAADLAIAAGGTSAWERCCLGLPTYIIKIAENQEKIFQELGTAKTFEEFFCDVSTNYQKYSDDITKFTDGMGVNKVLEKILKRFS